MRLHWKNGHKMHRDGHHHLKHKHFKRMMLHPVFNEDDLPCKKKHFKRMMKGRPMLAGKWKHFKGMRGHSSSDSDDSDHHHGKGKHFKHMMKGRSMLAPGHHGKGKHFRDHSSSDSDDNDHHRGRGKHFKGMRGWCMSNSDDDRNGKRVERCMPGTEKSHHHDGKGNPFQDVQGRSKSCSDNEGMHARMSNDEGGRHHHRRMHFMGRQGHPMTDTEGGHHGRGRHFKDVQGLSKSCSDDEEMQRLCMSNDERGHHHRRMPFIGRQGRSMTDVEEGHHGKGRHFHGGMQRGHMSKFDGHHDKGNHMRGMMHHHKGKHWMKGHGRRGFFDEDSALVPICAIEAEGRTETLANENTLNQATKPVEVVDENTRTKDQGTQTSGIMEIVIEDQEALSAAIRIVNKFL